MTISLFFTYGVSLKIWAETGLLTREVRLYHELMRCYGVQVQFITYGDECDREWEPELQGIKLLPIYERLKPPKSKVLAILQTLLIPWHFRQELRRTDLLKTNQMSGSWVAVISKWFFRKPLLVRCGYEAYKNSLEEDKSNHRRYILRLLSWLAYLCADHVWLSTHEISEFVQHTFSISSGRITIHPNWIDTGQFAPFDKIKRFKDRILFVGRLSVEKNLPLLFKALQGRNLHLDILGVGDLGEELEDMAVNMGLKIQFIDRISNDQMPELYNRYNVYVLCSRYEGNPKTLLEAMSCGCAVIGTDVSGIREVIQHESSGLLVSEDHNSLRSAIQRLLTDHSLCRKLGEQARQQIEVNNSLEIALSKENTVYEKLIKQ